MNDLFGFAVQMKPIKTLERLCKVHAQLFIPLWCDVCTHIESRKISMAHTQTDNLACIFRMLSWAKHFTVKNDISYKAASLSHCCLLCLDDFAAAIPFLELFGQTRH